MRYLQGLPVERRVRMFSEFLNWLEREGNVWNAMESKGWSAVSKNPKPSTTLHVESAEFLQRQNVGGSKSQHRRFNCAYCKDDSTSSQTWN